MTNEEKIAILDNDAVRIRARKSQDAEKVAVWEQLERERIAAGEPEPDPESCVEVLARQRRWFATARQRAAQSVDASGGYFPNPLDRETQIEIVYLNSASVEFFSADVTFESGPPATIRDVVQRAVDAESASSAKDKLVDSLREELDEAHRKIGQSKGGKK